MITVPDGHTQSSGGNIGVWRVHSPFRRPGALRITTVSSLPPTSQGIYTCIIPDSNSNMLIFNIGLYPTGFNGELLVFNLYIHAILCCSISLPSTVTPTISNLTYYHRTLTCESTGSPATSVSWMKDGDLLTTDGPTGYILTQTVTDRPSSTYSNVLTVSETTTGGVASTYTCIVANDLGSHARKIVAIGN